MSCGQDQNNANLVLMAGDVMCPGPNKANPVLATGDVMCPGLKTWGSGPDGWRWHVSRTKTRRIRSWRRAMACSQNQNKANQVLMAGDGMCPGPNMANPVLIAGDGMWSGPKQCESGPGHMLSRTIVGRCLCRKGARYRPQTKKYPFYFFKRISFCIFAAQQRHKTKI